ncbi:hypothetical protein LWI29_026434 [Acer saccharum]|uniref:Uncharacterized protein n=1 Tax=Acer saccharum TaxID=4024 RepID=A0AA39VP88_ACESA|nr:hypothetical protein LWI29_026434 [Acer saccharum]
MVTASTLPIALALQPSFSSPFTATSKLTFPIFSRSRGRHGFGAIACAHAAISSKDQGAFDPELRIVLELATDSELYELERILFGPSYFSPLLKSITNRADVDYVMIEEDLEERELFIATLESRFLFLAADARSTLRGWRPSYRNVLLAVRKKLNIPCSSKLSTEDLEVEIFLHLLREYASEESGIFPGLWESSEASNNESNLELGLSQWKVQGFAALKVGAAQLKSMMLKGGGIYTLAKVYQLLARSLSGKVFLEAANYQIKKEVLSKGGQLAAINLESRAALLAAKQGFAGAATKYLGFRSLVTLLGPMLWGTLLADVVIQMLGTDYARVLRAIYAFAQIRITRTYRYVLSTAVVGVTYTLVQLPFALLYAFKQKRLIRGELLSEFDFYGDKVVSLFLGTGVGAGFAVTFEFKDFLKDLFETLADLGFAELAGEFEPKLDKFLDRGNIATGLLFVAFICTALLSVLSSINKRKT